MNKQIAARRLLHIITVLLAISIVAFCYAIKKVKVGIGQTLIIIGSVLLFSMAWILVGLLILVLRAKKGNYFLYDPRTQSEIPVEDLTVDRISERLTAYMAMFRRGRQLYLAELFDEDGEVPTPFKPLFCYQLLGMLSASEADAQLVAFLSCGKELADALSTYLTLADDEPIAREIQILIAQFDGENVAPLREYLLQKSDYLARRMLVYTKAHIHEFDA